MKWNEMEWNGMTRKEMEWNEIYIGSTYAVLVSLYSGNQHSCAVKWNIPRQHIRSPSVPLLRQPTLVRSPNGTVWVSGFLHLFENPKVPPTEKPRGSFFLAFTFYFLPKYHYPRFVGSPVSSTTALNKVLAGHLHPRVPLLSPEGLKIDKLLFEIE